MKKNALPAALLLLACCMPYTKLLTIVDQPLAPARTAWEKYGAYFETDDLFIETSYLWTPVMEGPQTKYVVNKRLRILTTDGTQHASVEVPRYAMLNKCRLVMRDSLGQVIRLDTGKLRREYLESGVVVFPRATAGCALDVMMEFTEMRPITSFEFAFFEDIPVSSSTFTFSYLSTKYRYAYKAYGDPSSHSEQIPKAVMGDFTQQVWKKKDLLPPPRIAYMKSIYETVSRVSLVMKGYVTSQVLGSEQEIFGSWQKLSKSYNDILFKPSFFKSSSKLKKKVRELTDTVTGDMAKADAVLRWVQENITFAYTGSQSMNPDKVLVKGEGNMWEITFLLKEMYAQLGCFSDIIVTRPKFRGGFDPEFVTPVVLSIPLVIVDIANKKYVAYPYLRGSKLGECPATYFNLKGLSVESGEIKTLPAPFSEKWNCTFSYSLAFGADSISQKLNAAFTDYWAFDMRTDLVSEKKVQVTEYFQKMMTALGISNALTSCAVKNLENRGAPLNVEIGFENPGQFIERKKERLFKLDHLFGSYFSFYDTSRTSRFSTDMDQSVVEEIVIPRNQNLSITFHMKCNPLDNKLFRVSCEERSSDREYRFVRTLQIKKADLSAMEMQLLYPDILKMQEINESYIAIK